MSNAFLFHIKESSLRDDLARYERENDWPSADVEDAVRETRLRAREAVLKTKPTQDLSTYQQRNCEALRRIALDAFDRGLS